MLNRSALNAAPLGSAVGQPWILLAATQVMEFVGTCRMSVQKVMKSTQSFTLSGDVSLPVKVSMAAEQAFALTSSAVLHALRPVTFSAQQLITLVGTSRLYAEVIMPAVQTLQMTYQAVLSKLTAQHLTATQEFMLESRAVINDIYIGEAPDERTTSVVPIKTQTAPSVNAGGQ